MGVVAGDGNCGFRSIAVSLGLSEDKWPVIRKDLKNALMEENEMYCKILGEKLYAEVLKSVEWEKGPAPKDNWMQMPDLGYAVATVYKRPLYFFSQLQNFTFLPLDCYSSICNTCISIAHVNGDHFVPLELHSNSPIPPIIHDWETNASEKAKSWLNKISKNLLKKWDDMWDQHMNGREIVSFDLST